jgi:hypothetical protein
MTKTGKQISKQASEKAGRVVLNMGHGWGTRVLYTS